MKTMLALLVLAMPLAAQQTTFPRSGDWRVRFDRNVASPDSAMRVDQMGPGWHFYAASNGSAIAYRPGQTAQGNFRVEAVTFLFPTTGHRDGYGLMLGGRELDAATQNYLYFLVRGDGRYLIKHRGGAQTHDIVTWTAHPAIPRLDTTNVSINLAAEARTDSVLFFVNNQRVHALPRTAAPVDGIVGLRINHGLSVHVSSLTVSQR